MARRVNPVVAAGLLGTAWSVIPVPALALSPSDVVGVVLSSPMVSLVVGFAGGVVATGAVVLFATRGWNRGGSHADSAGEPPASSSDETSEAPVAAVPDSAPVVPSDATPALATDGPAAVGEDVTADVTSAAEGPDEAYQPRHLARPGEAPRCTLPVRPDEDEVEGGPEAPAGEALVLVVGPRDEVERVAGAIEDDPEGFAAAVVAASAEEPTEEAEVSAPVVEADMEAVAAPSGEATADTDDVPADAPHAAAPDAPRPYAGPAHAAAPDELAPDPMPERPAGRPPRHAASDYEDIAESYVRRLTFRERMARQAAGVASALSARIEAGRMEGVPRIERAQGVDIEPGSDLWAQAVAVDTYVGASDSAEPQVAYDRPAAVAPEPVAQPAPSYATAAERAQGIASRVPFVDEGAFPLVRTAEEAARPVDLWDEALQSLDERPVEDPEPLAAGFADVIGASDTLDEPDNLESSTQFIPFRMPAGHPEVVDTDSYVDYLIDEEFSKNSSRAARRSSRRYLRVLEGGTASERPVGRHFSTAAAAEA